MIAWFANNHVAANLLMFALVIAGLFTVRNDIAFEIMPNIELESVTISTLLPGGTPGTIESSITNRVEEAIAAIEGIKEITSMSTESISTVIAEIENGYDKNDVLNDIKIQVDALSTLPADAERPIIQIAEILIQAVGICVVSDTMSFDELYTFTGKFRQGMLKTQGITKIGEMMAPGREIHIEFSPETLQRYNLTLDAISNAIRRNSLDISAGNLQTSDGDILIRADGQGYFGNDFANIPIIQSGDKIVYLNDIATITDGFEQIQVSTEYEGKQAIIFEVFRVGKQSTIDVVAAARQYISAQQGNLPSGVEVVTYGDTAEVVNDRLNMLMVSALQGGLLVLIVLSLFLRPEVAFWVGIGIPVSFLGTFALMPVLGLSMNMITMFGFLMVLGIVVDDAIVTGENIYRHINNGMPSNEAAIFGTKEVAVPVTFGVVTTMVAFSPMLMVEGSMSTLAKQLPLVIIPALAFSLVESKLILPAHMSHIKSQGNNRTNRFTRFQQNFANSFELAIIKYYKPLLKRCINNKAVTMALATALFFIFVSLLPTGWVKTSFFPNFENDVLLVDLKMPSTIGFSNTSRHIDHIVDSARRLQERYQDPDTGESYIEYIFSVKGATPSNGGMPELGVNNGLVIIQLVALEKRPDNFSIKTLADELREEIGEIPGVKQLVVTSDFLSVGRPLSVTLSSNQVNQIPEQLISDIRAHFATYDGVFDIQDNYSDGKEEIEITLSPLAHTLGVTLADLSLQLQSLIYGQEVQRIQRGHDELKVMTRLSAAYRSEISDLLNIPIKVRDSSELVKLGDLADLSYQRSTSAIRHIDRNRAITISADINDQVSDLNIIRNDLKQFMDRTMSNYFDLTYSIDGQAETQKETTDSLALGLILVLLVIYSLLAIPFKSFSQPLVVMSVIPLSFVGAIIGHMLLGQSISLMSMLGFLALCGIVINDSLVLVDFINQERARGKSVMDAIFTSGEVRFRPIALTSMTTFVGLLPIMMNNSMHAQTLIPMATSLGFGILFATLITLIIVPINYLIHYELQQWWQTKRGPTTHGTSSTI